MGGEEVKAYDFNQGWRFYKRGEPERSKKVNLPHDAMMDEPRIPDLVAGENSGYFPGGSYVYEKVFCLPKREKDSVWILAFDGVFQKSSVYVNGQKAGGCINGYRQFYVPLSGWLRKGKNEIRVEVNNTQTPNSRWYTGSGIYRNVELLEGPETYIIPDGIRVCTKSFSPAVLEISVAVKTEKDAGPEGVDLQIADGHGRPLSGKEVSVRAKGQEEKGKFCIWRFEAELADPSLWSDETPYLYSVTAALDMGGNTGDTQELKFGVHALEWSPEKGLCGNGRELKLRGACVHHDNGILGACEFKETAYRKIRKLKEAGYNAVRTAHNPPSRFFLNACDELGMYVMAEFSDVWKAAKNDYDYALYFDEVWEQDLEAMVDKLYSHPSVVMYAIGNEVSDVAKKNGLETNRMLADKMRDLDPTRPVSNCVHILTASSPPADKPLRLPEHARDEKVDPCRTGKESPMVGSKLMNMVATFLPRLAQRVTPQKVVDNLGEMMKALDVTGLNYANHLADSLADFSKDKIYVHSETYPAVIGKTWPRTLRHKNVVGDFMWTGWDYLGEAGIGVVQYGRQPRKLNKPYPCISSGTGSINLVGEIEAQGAYARIVFGGDRNPYIGVRPVQYSGMKRKMSQWRGTDAIHSWSFCGYEGKKTEIEIFSNGCETELFQNGKSLGRKKLENFKADFLTVYEPGILEARSYDAGGRCTGRSMLRSASSHTRITAYPERDTLVADGNDIVYIRAALTDEKGITKVLETKDIHVTVEGSAALLAVGSGSPVTEETYREDHFTTYYGSMAAVIRSTESEGKVRVSFRADGLPEEIVELTAIRTEDERKVL